MIKLNIMLGSSSSKIDINNTFRLKEYLSKIEVSNNGLEHNYNWYPTRYVGVIDDTYKVIYDDFYTDKGYNLIAHTPDGDMELYIDGVLQEEVEQFLLSKRPVVEDEPCDWYVANLIFNSYVNGVRQRAFTMNECIKLEMLFNEMRLGMNDTDMRFKDNTRIFKALDRCFIGYILECVLPGYSRDSFDYINMIRHNKQGLARVTQATIQAKQVESELFNLSKMYEQILN